MPDQEHPETRLSQEEIEELTALEAAVGASNRASEDRGRAAGVAVGKAEGLSESMGTVADIEARFREYRESVRYLTSILRGELPETTDSEAGNGDN